MGVAGAGKTLIGAKLAEALGFTFLDADDFHPGSNIDKMRGGAPLAAADRAPWLEAIRNALLALQRERRDVVLGCSALAASFRAALAEGLSDVRFVYLKASPDLIRARVASRDDHFMPASLVDSQFATLEEPDDAIVVDASEAPEVIVERAMKALTTAD